MSKVVAVAQGNCWLPVGKPESAIAKILHKNIALKKKQDALRPYKGLLELGLIEKSDYAEIKRRTFKRVLE